MGSNFRARTFWAFFSLAKVVGRKIGGTTPGKLGAWTNTLPDLINPQDHSSRKEVTNNHADLVRMLIALGFVSLLFLAGCGGSGGSTNQPPPLKSVPTIFTISPGSVAAEGPAFTLTINGANFDAASIVNFGGTAAATTFVSAAQLTAAIPAAAIASVGTVGVTVTNPVTSGGTSNSVTFTVTRDLVPAITSLVTICAPVGGQAFTLQVIGSSFQDSSVVRWNGSDRPTTFLDDQDIRAQILASDIATTGTAAVTVFTPGGGSSNSLNFTVTAGGVSPQSIAIDPTGKFAYVANEGCLPTFAGDVSMYTIDKTTGALASIGPPVAADIRPRSVTVDPSGKFVYVANRGLGSMSMYTLDLATGNLTPIGTIPAGGHATSVAVHPSGKFAYVGNGYPEHTVSTYTINATTGALTSVGTIDAVSSGRSFIFKVAVDPSGKFAHAEGDECLDDIFDGEVSMYTINPTTGTLTSIGPAVAAGACSSSVTVDPFGKFAYVTNGLDDNVSTYAINATTGALTPIGTTAAGSRPSSIAIHPSGKFAYVTNLDSNNISMYTVDATQGALTSMGTIAAGSSPSSIAIHPSGKFAYVTNSYSNSVSMYTIDPATGALTLIGTVGT